MINWHWQRGNTAFERVFITAQSSLGGEAQSGVEALQGPCCHRQNAAVSQRSPGAYVRARNAALEAKENELTTALAKQTELNEVRFNGSRQARKVLQKLQGAKQKLGHILTKTDPQFLRQILTQSGRRLVQMALGSPDVRKKSAFNNYPRF